MKTKFNKMGVDAFIKLANKKVEIGLEDIVPKKEFQMFLEEMSKNKEDNTIDISELLTILKQRGLSEFQLGALTVTVGILVPVLAIEQHLREPEEIMLPGEVHTPKRLSNN